MTDLFAIARDICTPPPPVVREIAQLAEATEALQLMIEAELAS